jgi:REP element-mobilizing transposase RayT
VKPSYTQSMARQRHYRNPVDAGICVFVTTTILDFVPIFREPKMADLFIVEMLRIHRKYGARLQAFVVMPEHVHMLITLPEDKAALAFVGKLKSDTALAILPRLSPEVRRDRSACQRGGGIRPETGMVGGRGLNL